MYFNREPVQISACSGSDSSIAWKLSETRRNSAAREAFAIRAPDPTPSGQDEDDVAVEGRGAELLRKGELERQPGRLGGAGAEGEEQRQRDESQDGAARVRNDPCIHG